jgi:CheY-like chemotaxis protein
MRPSTEISRNSQSTVRILVADADEDARSLYRESLEIAGCDVVDAADGRDALVKALSHRPTL